MTLISIILLSALTAFVTSSTPITVGIVNGTEAKPHSRPYMVSIQNESKIHICGGFLVSKDFVMTAAHCYKKHGEHLTVVVGAHNLKDGDNERIHVKDYKQHPNYIPDSCWSNDIMLLKLQRSVEQSEKVNWINMGEDAPREHSICSVAGWGRQSTNGPPSILLMETNVSVSSHKTCRDHLKHCYKDVGVLCAGGIWHGFCQGDSGGPLVCNGNAVGISSLNIDKNRNINICESKKPNIYTKILDFLPWIKSIMGKKYFK